VRQFGITPKALANFSPVLERSDNPGYANNENYQTLKGFAARGTLSGLFMKDDVNPRVVAALQPLG
jgi:hypothetical protein